MATAKEQIPQMLYEIYQLDWMMKHGCSIQQLVNGLHDYADDSDIYDDEENGGLKTDIQGVFLGWEQNRGFGGEIWASFEEFMDTEFKDMKYVNNVLIPNISDYQIRYQVHRWYVEQMRKEL